MHSFRFIHAADIHLDSPLRGLKRDEGPAAELLHRASREALRYLIARTIDEEAAFLLIAGDLFDGPWRDYQTALFFIRQMGKLREAEIPVCLIYGNHDAISTLTRSLTLPPNVVEFRGHRARTHLIDKYRVAIHGQSFHQRQVTENLAVGYPDPLDGYFNIGMLHTSLAGAEGHDTYAPCSLDELVSKGYDYWALGHVHNPTICHRDPYVVYPGVLQGRHIRETGPKGAMLVSVQDGAVSSVDPVQVGIVRWRVVEVSASECHTTQDLVDAMHRRIEEDVLGQDDMRLLAYRVCITGRSPAHYAALASHEHLLAEARAAAEGLGQERVWIEKLVVATEPASQARRTDGLADIFGDISDACTDEDLLKQLKDTVGTFVKKLELDVRKESEDPFLHAAVDEDYRRLIELARPIALARLSQGGN